MTGPPQNAASSLWDEEFFRLNKEEKAIAADFRNWLRSSGCDLGRFLANVNERSHAGIFDRKDVSVLETLIVRSCSHRPDKALRLRILSKIVYNLNRRYQLSIPPPRYILSITPEPNPFFTSEAFPSGHCTAHQIVNLCLKMEREWIASLSPYDHPKIGNKRENIPLELIVFSAALHGGLADLDLAVALFEALIDPGDCFHLSSRTGRVYTDLLVAAQGLADQETRRWYPDDMLICLIARVSLTTDLIRFKADLAAEKSVATRRKRIADRIWTKAEAEFERQQKLKSDYDAPRLPKTFKSLLESLRIVMHSELPSILAEYASRMADCRSLLGPSVARIYGDPVIARPTAPAAEDEDETIKAMEEVDLDDQELYGGDSPADAEPGWLPDLREALAGEDLEKFSEQLNRLIEEQPSLQPRQRFCAFALRLVKRGSSYGSKLRPSSIRCLALTAARRIGGVLGEQDPAPYSSASLETLYLRVIDDARHDVNEPRRMQRRVTWVLREFHRFLVSECDAETINEAEVFRFPRGLLPVDARIVSVDDIFAAIYYLDKKWQAALDPARKANIQIAQAEIVFGFFAGLRRMEGLKMQKVDYIPGHLPEVIVRANEVRALKTANATRRIPLGLMTFPFRDFLDDPNAAFLDSKSELPEGQTSKSDAKNELFFATASDNTIIPIIHDALQAVTGDRTLHYHTLRHSFCCWTFLRLMLSELPEIPDLFPQPEMDQTMDWLRASQHFRDRLYRNSTVSNDHLWCVSTLMGHAAPPSSLSSYLHVLDLLLPLFLQQSKALGERPDSDFRRALDLRKTQSHERLPSIGDTVGLTTVRRQERAQIAVEMFRRRFKDGAPVVNPGAPAASSWLDQAWDLLDKHGRGGKSKYFPIVDSPFEPEDAAKILNRAAAFSEFRVLGSADRHPMLDQRCDARKKKVARGCCPKKPETKSTLALASSLAAQFDEIRTSHSSQIKNSLDAFARSVLPDSCRVVFTPPLKKSVIQSYIDLLQSMAPGMILHYRSRDGSQNLRPDPVFPTSCGIPQGATVVNITEGNADRYLPVGGLSIEPVLAGALKTADQQRELQEALRFVLLMAAITFGESSKEKDEGMAYSAREQSVRFRK